MNKKVISRRDFLATGSTAAMVTVFPCAALAADKKRPLLRPPGAVNEEEFLARCNRCHRCVQVCPTRVIFSASFSKGLTRMNTPELIFNHSYCNACMKCTEVCPTRALEPTPKEEIDIGEAIIIKDCCVAWYWIGCTVCVDKCPLNAIILDSDKRPVVDQEKCNGCGICEQVCPSQSLRTGIKGRGILIYPHGYAHE